MIKGDGWLAAILDRPTFRVDAGDAAAVARHMTEEGRDAFYFSKVDTADVETTRALLKAGFFVADVNVTFSARPVDVTGGGDGAAVRIDAAGHDGDDEVLAVAHDSFRFTRFHLDPLVGASRANAVKREWVRNYLERKRGDRLFVARTSGRPVGFLAALRVDHGSPQAVIDLVGVHPSAQRQGVGRALVAAFASHYRDAAELLVGTQVANAPSIRLYETMGFRFKASQYVLHAHTRGGLPV